MKTNRREALKQTVAVAAGTLVATKSTQGYASDSPEEPNLNDSRLNTLTLRNPIMRLGFKTNIKWFNSKRPLKMPVMHSSFFGERLLYPYYFCWRETDYYGGLKFINYEEEFESAKIEIENIFNNKSNKWLIINNGNIRGLTSDNNLNLVYDVSNIFKSFEELDHFIEGEFSEKYKSFIDDKLRPQRSPQILKEIG